MKAVIGLVLFLIAIAVAFLAGMLVERLFLEQPGAVAPLTRSAASTLWNGDTRPVVSVANGETGTIDDWAVTAGFREITAPYGYGKRRLDFDVRIEWKGGSPPGELMNYNFLESAMRFVSPSGQGCLGAPKGHVSRGPTQ